MPSFEDCLEYAKKIEKKSELFKIVDSCERSQIILLKNKNSKYDNFILKKK
jgi:hypothetical protein